MAEQGSEPRPADHPCAMLCRESVCEPYYKVIIMTEALYVLPSGFRGANLYCYQTTTPPPRPRGSWGCPSSPISWVTYSLTVLKVEVHNLVPSSGWRRLAVLPFLPDSSLQKVWSLLLSLGHQSYRIRGPLQSSTF